GRRLIGVRRPAEAPAILHPTAGPVGVVGSVGAGLGPQFLCQAALSLLEALRATARHRLRVRRALGLQALLGLAQPPAATLRGPELRRQLIPRFLAIELILGLVNRLRLLDLARELLVVEVLVARRVRLQ